jgi:hypothetical protein
MTAVDAAAIVTAARGGIATAVRAADHDGSTGGAKALSTDFDAGSTLRR